ncbi:MAG: Hint domain-containing protein [Roseovarius sp.]|nr:Hint domain-containing protein [uncultured Roseovarius sp.]MDX1784670.1 Hint domain-containing protein [Roseovarius sp.]
MVYTPSAASLANASRVGPGLADNAATMPGLDSPRAQPTISYDVQYLCGNGQIGEARHSAPATPPFIDAFSAFARGTLITTTHGPVAVEDLMPGMRLQTGERGPSPLLWIGTITLRPDACAFGGTGPRLIRVMADALGISRPMTDFMAGPGARVLRRDPNIQDQTLRPVRDMLDGTQVIELRPPSAVQLFHLLLPRHATIMAAGLSVETFHPGPGFDHSMTQDELALFLGFFPHIRKPVEFGSLAHPRAPLRPQDGWNTA